MSWAFGNSHGDNCEADQIDHGHPLLGTANRAFRPVVGMLIQHPDDHTADAVDGSYAGDNANEATQPEPKADECGES